MTYDEIRPLIRTGDLIEWRTSSLLGAAIRRRTKQDVNHTSMALEYALIGCSDRRVCVCESLGRGTHPYFLSTRLCGFKGAVYWIRFKQEIHRNQLAEEMLKLVGKPYGYWDLVESLFRHAKINDQHLVCSEAIQTALINCRLLDSDFNGGRILFPGQFHLTGLYEQIRVQIN